MLDKLGPAGAVVVYEGPEKIVKSVQLGKRGHAGVDIGIRARSSPQAYLVVPMSAQNLITGNEHSLDVARPGLETTMLCEIRVSPYPYAFAVRARVQKAVCRNRYRIYLPTGLSIEATHLTQGE